MEEEQDLEKIADTDLEAEDAPENEPEIISPAQTSEPVEEEKEGLASKRELPPELQRTPRKFGLKANFQIGTAEEKKEIFCVDFDSDDKFLVAGVGDGSVCIYNLMTSKQAHAINYSNAETGDAARAMSVKFRTISSTGESGTVRKQNLILAGYSDGVINEYVSPTGKLQASITEEDNEIYVLVVDEEGNKFCSAGKDYRVRVYDAETKELIQKMVPIYSSETGHSKRIFGLAYKDDDHNTIVSGGWDKTLQIHDIRKGGPVHYIFGPELCGNAIDIRGNLILTGSYKGKNSLQTWDLRMREVVQTIEWDYSGEVSDTSYLN